MNEFVVGLYFVLGFFWVFFAVIGSIAIGTEYTKSRSRADARAFLTVLAALVFAPLYPVALAAGLVVGGHRLGKLVVEAVRGADIVPKL